MSVALIALIVGISGCSGESASRAAAPSSSHPISASPPLQAICPDLELQEIPKSFPALPLPPGSVSIKPAAAPHEGELRVDLFTPSEVATTYRFFLSIAKKRGFQIIFRDFEGFEAEVFLRSSVGDNILITTVQSCDGSIVVIKAFTS